MERLKPNGFSPAGMAELADAPDLGSGGAIHAGSSPVTRTTSGFITFDKSARFFLSFLMYTLVFSLSYWANAVGTLADNERLIGFP